MFFVLESILYLVALFTSPVFSLPVGSSSLVARQDGNPQRQLFCHYNVRDCREQFGWYCKEANPPPWCFSTEPPSPAELAMDSTSLLERQDDNIPPELAHQMFCELNAEFCRMNYPEECMGGRDVAPAWCHVSSPPTEVPSSPPARLYCKHQAEFCRKAFPEDCNAGNDMVPEWCHVQQPPTEPPTKGPDDKTALVPRQDDNPARQLFCEKNAEYCQEHYPGYCKPGNDKIPSWCHIKSPPTSVSTSDHALIARQDPDREEEKREKEEMEKEEHEHEHEQQQHEEEEEEEEEENPHPFERSWCKKHPHHPYCYSQFCMDNPGRCKKAGDWIIAEKLLPNEPPQNISKRDKKGGWYCFWLC